MVNQKNKAYVIIMAQQQHVADVHPDELCPPNKRYDLIDANKKVDLEHVQCPSKSKILTNIIKNHPLRFSIAASSFVPWIYMAQTIFHLSTELTTIKNSFMPPPSFSDMVLFYKQVLGFTMELKTSSSFKTSGLLQPWQTLCKIFSKCLTTRVTGWDQPPLQIMQMMYCFVNNIHVDYTSTIGRMYLFPQYQHFDSISKIYKDHYVPLTQSQPTESTQGKHRTPSAPRSPNPNKEAAESSDPRRSTMIRLLQSKNDESNIRGTRIEPRSNKESPEVEITKDKEVEITKDKEVEITNSKNSVEDFELSRLVLAANLSYWTISSVVLQIQQFSEVVFLFSKVVVHSRKCPYEFKNFVPEGSTIPRFQTVEDLEGDDLLRYDVEMELMNMILLSIPNEIYNSVDACTSAKDMWKRVGRLMMGTIQNKVDRETRFMNKFDQFVAEPGEALVSVYNRFAQQV
ncbi:hypothetical protein Tco_1285457 [Tanacetum coccineum]